jgi:hypothetical protein
MIDGLRLHYSNPKFNGKPWAIDKTRKKASKTTTIKPYLGDRPAAVRAHKRRERQAWLTVADREIAAGKTVRLESAVLPSLEKVNRRAHELHVRRLENLKRLGRL